MADIFCESPWSLCEAVQAVANYTCVSCDTNITRYVWGLDLSGTHQGAGGVGGLLAVISPLWANPRLLRIHPLWKGGWGGGGADGGLFYPCYDANGNITEYVDTNGVVVAHYAYDAFGNLTPNSSFLTPNSPDFRFRFSTKYLDAETGLYDYIKRPYSPKLQRFISRDPIEEQGGLNLYGFCGNDPINKWDYLGMNVPADPSKMSASDYASKVKWRYEVQYQQTGRVYFIFSAASVYPHKLAKVFLICEPYTSRFFQTNGSADSL